MPKKLIEKEMPSIVILGVHISMSTYIYAIPTVEVETDHKPSPIHLAPLRLHK